MYAIKTKNGAIRPRTISESAAGAAQKWLISLDISVTQMTDDHKIRKLFKEKSAGLVELVRITVYAFEAVDPSQIDATAHEEVMTAL